MIWKEGFWDVPRGILIAAGVIAAMACSSPAASQVLNSRMIGNWFLAELHSPALGAPQCIANTTFPNGTKLELALSTSSTSFRVSFENPDWTSLNSFDSGPRGDQRMPITLTFVGTEHSLSAPFLVLKQSRFNGTPGISSGFLDDQMEETVLAFAAARSLSVRSPNHLIGDFPMTGSAAAMGGLVGCVQSIMADRDRRQSNDPFRN